MIVETWLRSGIWSHSFLFKYSRETIGFSTTSKLYEIVDYESSRTEVTVLRCHVKPVEVSVH